MFDQDYEGWPTCHVLFLSERTPKDERQIGCLEQTGRREMDVEWLGKASLINQIELATSRYRELVKAVLISTKILKNRVTDPNKRRICPIHKNFRQLCGFRERQRLE